MKNLENEKDKEYFQKIEREANIIASETDMVGDTPTMQKVAEETFGISKRLLRISKRRTCEGCGLANADNECEPANHNISPCRFCNRNRKTQMHVTDFHNEKWCLDSNNEAIMETPITPHEVRLLKLLRDIDSVYGGEIEEVKTHG